MAEPKITQLPYMGPPKDTDKEKKDKKYKSSVPTTAGTSLAVPIGPDKLDRDYAKGGKVSSASKRADGIAQRGKTRGRVL